MWPGTRGNVLATCVGWHRWKLVHRLRPLKTREVWHPKWEGKINDGVNLQFIKVAADCIWENEQVSIFTCMHGYVLIFHRGCGTVKTGEEKLLMMISQCQ
jgi:hypothetical protein